MDRCEAYLEEQRARSVDDLVDFLRIPSISSLTEHAADVQRAAEWVAARLKRAGIEAVQVLPTNGHPVVYGQWLRAPGRPRVLIYGHFDVQPVDPLDLWTTPPFEPLVRDERIYARGASDNKGNMLAPIIAAEAILRTDGSLPINLKFLFEGQEEIGSPFLSEFIAAHRELLACDLALNADGGQWREDQPSLLIGLRGLCGLQLDIKGANTDLHSGIFGGAVQNPIHALVRILNSMRSADGRILVEGFYDRVRPLTEEEREQIASVPFDEAAYMRRLGLSELFGESGYTTLERIWARPTLEVNGIWGGFQGEGVKTVTPNGAHAKLTCRLVPDQDPEQILECVAVHIERNTPPGVIATTKPLESHARPYLMPADHPGNRAAAAVLADLYGKQPVFVREGGSVPVTALILEHLGVYTTGFAFSLHDENFHAPNEFFRLKSFSIAQRAYCKILYHLAQSG